MSLRSLLVPVTGLSGDELVLDAAFSLARSFGAHISVVSIRPDPADVVRYAVEWSYPILMDEAVAVAQEHSLSVARQAAATFERWRLGHQLPLADTPLTNPEVTVSWDEGVGPPNDILRDRARFADLVVMRGLRDDNALEADSMLEAVLFDVGRPILLVPPKPVEMLSATALIAWDGAREALHAITAAMPLLRRMGNVRILTIDGDDGTKARELSAYLAWHGIVATTHAATASSKSIGDALLDEAHEIEAGILIMGGYHHSRTRQILFGGTTRHIAFSSKIPVLLAH